MGKNSAYRNKTCGYCGQPTGPTGQGEHVFPACMYPPLLTDGKVQRVKIPACRQCNFSFQADEAHARNILSACGLVPTPERIELWNTVCRSIRRKEGGIQDGLAILAQMQNHAILKPDGNPYKQIFPLRDARVVRIMRKIVRGLCFRQTEEVISDENRVVLFPHPSDPDDLALFEKVYQVPNVFLAYALIADRCPEVHSLWFLEFYKSVTMGGFICPIKVPAA